MENFIEAIEVCGLYEVQFQGDSFTWSNRREWRCFTKEKLDRAFGNQSWFNLFTDSSVGSLAAQCSDHCPILLLVGNDEGERKKTQSFRYEASWGKREECQELIVRA
ncbi:uncharacterized protein LOC109008014 [Juglans regia]|uniref:Uncharacterized protein LOC109008014 n=1 Tax=Juglans regia TaxID=51240 RepID=A0A2I4GHX1_JUGRE|nr:uncharacterized protein LOC109008014 [Juglans regia]